MYHNPVPALPNISYFWRANVTIGLFILREAASLLYFGTNDSILPSCMHSHTHTLTPSHTPHTPHLHTLLHIHRNHAFSCTNFYQYLSSGSEVTPLVYHTQHPSITYHNAVPALLNVSYFWRANAQSREAPSFVLVLIPSHTHTLTPSHFHIHHISTQSYTPTGIMHTAAPNTDQYLSSERSHAP